VDHAHHVQVVPAHRVKVPPTIRAARAENDLAAFMPTGDRASDFLTVCFPWAFLAKRRASFTHCGQDREIGQIHTGGTFRRLRHRIDDCTFALDKDRCERPSGWHPPDRDGFHGSWNAPTPHRAHPSCFGKADDAVLPMDRHVWGMRGPLLAPLRVKGRITVLLAKDA
jgi:hypothetical protein